MTTTNVRPPGYRPRHRRVRRPLLAGVTAMVAALFTLGWAAK